MKKVVSVGLAVTTAAWLSGAALAIPVASAQTVADLQLQIQQLLATVQALTAQLNVLSGGGTTTGGSTYNFTRDLTLGSKGDDVMALQQFLNAQGFAIAASGAGSAGNETTYFGSLTQAALAKWQASKGVTPSVGYFGPKTRAAVAAMTPTTPSTVVIPGTGLAVTLALDTPAGMAIPKGAANVPFLKFNVAGSGTINSITVKRVGAGATTDFSNVYLYDGATRLTSGRSVNSSTHEVTFTGLNVAVSGVKTLTISADIASSPGAANQSAFQVIVVGASVSVSGIPVTGNTMTNSNATAGTLTVAKSGSLSNPNIGQSSAAVSQFKLTAASEDVKVMRVALFQGGTVSKSNISNFVLQDLTGNTVATASGVNDRDLVVFEFSSPVTILKGDSKDFKVLADIGGGAKKDETVKLYVDEASDVYGVGQQYGQGATVTKTMNSTAANHHVMTLLGATLTSTFLGPNAGDIRKNGKDITLYEFNMAAANNLEIKKLNASVATTAGSWSGDSALADFKVVDRDTGIVIAGPVDLAVTNANLTTGYTFTDIFNITAGQVRHLKITADIPNDWDDADAIRVSLTAFVASQDVKNLDNNQLLVAAEIVPTTVLTGNIQTTKAPSLEISLAGVPASQSFVKGTQGVPFVGIGLRAIADDIKLTSLKITSTSSSVTDDDMIADVQSLALYDGATRISDIKSLATVDASSSDATFTNLNFVIAKGTSKVLTVKGNLSATAKTNNIYELGIATATTANTTGSDVVAVDSEGNEPLYTGGTSANNTVNMASSRLITVLSSGSITVATAPDDSESKPGVIVTSAQKTVLGKFRFTSVNEELTVKKLALLINNDSSTAAAATSTAEISTVYLYDGATQVGSASGYTPIGSGSTAGQVLIENLVWTIGKDATKTLTVKADTNTIAAGATSGRSIYAHILPTNFQAQGAATNVTTNGTAGGAKGNLKVLYKTYPMVTAATPGGTLLTSGSNDLIKFTVANKSSNEQLSWNVVSFNMNTAAATAPLFGANTAAFTLRDLTNSVNLTITTTATAGSSTAGQYTFYLDTEEVIPAGASREYRISGTVTAPGTNSSISTQLVLRADGTAASIAKGVAYRIALNISTAGSAEPSGLGSNATVNAADSGFVWSDNSATAHSLTTSDWANGVYIDTYPSDTFSRSN